MENINIFNNIITILSFVVNLAFIIPFALKIYNYFTKKTYIKKVLGYKKDSVQISNSTFTLKAQTGLTNTFIKYSAVQATNNIINLFNIIEQSFYLVEDIKDAKNEMNIGGFLGNNKVNAYFVKYFEGFKFVTHIEYKTAYDNFPIDQRVIEYSSDKVGFKIDNDTFWETDKIDYGFLIKLINSDFKDDYEKTVHIVFGGSDIGTLKATEYLLTHYKQIYKKFGNNHYFFAIQINCIDNSIDYSKGIIDLTEKMFK
ncbi:hypothetical protein [Thomasclavelia cocleata]|uniref:hypothetical protein n=1 Tax=Thomasclavelia cocleata TaxID=69824 RepID=UPI00272B706C|nr:hypothetical protein [Thomasclavelia cocleata]